MLLLRHRTGGRRPPVSGRGQFAGGSSAPGTPNIELTLRLLVRREPLCGGPEQKKAAVDDDREIRGGDVDRARAGQQGLGE